MWWATVGFMVVEGWTLALCVAAYLYLRQNFETWPPLRTPYPSLLIPTINLVLLLISVWPAYMAQKASKKLDERRVRLWLTISGFGSLPILAASLVRALGAQRSVGHERVRLCGVGDGRPPFLAHVVGYRDSSPSRSFIGFERRCR
jgi:hypothetical protein